MNHKKLLDQAPVEGTEKELAGNVIQFPGRKLAMEEAKPSESSKTLRSGPAPSKSKPSGKPKIKVKPAGTVVAVILFSATVNHMAFRAGDQQSDLSSHARVIASVEPTTTRDANWEKQLAESLASAQVRSVASANIGHAATPEERLRWGILAEKYTIVYGPTAHRIKSISLPDSTTSPSYVLDRNQFLKDYGTLFEENFASARLKSVEVNHDGTVEAYTLFDHNQNPQGEARFELDEHKRLLSLKVEPLKI